VKASDADSGSNADIAYSVSDDHFAVDSSGIISNNRRLDADSNNAYYEFQVPYTTTIKLYNGAVVYNNSKIVLYGTGIVQTTSAVLECTISAVFLYATSPTVLNCTTIVQIL
jgi:hypothetical protein